MNTLKITLLLFIACTAFSQSEHNTRISTDSLHFTPLFNGVDLSGWESTGLRKSSWTVKDSVLSGRWRPWNLLSVGGWIWTKEEFADFVLRLDYKINPGGNSGVAIRWPKEAGARPAKSAYEVQIKDVGDDKNLSGSIYNLAIAPRGLANPGEWNSYEIRCIGDSLTVYLNGIKAAGLRDSRSSKGRIGFQVHDPFSKPQFRRIRIATLPR